MYVNGTRTQHREVQKCAPNRHRIAAQLELGLHTLGRRFPFTGARPSEGCDGTAQVGNCAASPRQRVPMVDDLSAMIGGR